MHVNVMKVQCERMDLYQYSDPYGGLLPRCQQSSLPPKSLRALTLVVRIGGHLARLLPVRLSDGEGSHDEAALKLSVKVSVWLLLIRPKQRVG